MEDISHPRGQVRGFRVPGWQDRAVVLWRMSVSPGTRLGFKGSSLANPGSGFEGQQCGIQGAAGDGLHDSGRGGKVCDARGQVT
jgi:hypothetical protein